MKKGIKTLLASALAAALLLTPALAAGEEAQPQLPSPWAYESLADSYAMGLLDDNYTSYILDPVSKEQLEVMTAVVADKLALLELPARAADADEAPLVIDTTRGGVMNALYQEAAAYQIEGVETGAAEFLAGLGVVKGTGADLALDRACTYQEAMVMANRLILALYDANDAGSKGLLWKATNGENTLYLLGTIHVDRDNVYPMHKSVRAAVAASQEVYFELDFNDAEGKAEFAAMQTYADGTTLADHISPELYERVIKTLTGMGMAEEEIAALKPWVLANSFNSLSLQDDTTSSNAVAMDVYFNSLAVNAGKEAAGVESYALQGNIFDTLSPEYQEAYLEATLSLYEAGLEGGDAAQEDKDAAAENQRLISEMFAAWKNRDPEAFSKVYDKTAILNSDDELNARLFSDRDPGMIKAAAALLEREGENTFFMAVGAGHMVDPGGIISGLKALGYTVELAA